MSDAIEFVRPFSNGEQYRCWTSNNCDRCALNGYLVKGVPECDMEVALSMGTITGKIHVIFAADIGAAFDADDPKWCDMPAQCKKFKDIDERDDDPEIPPPPPVDPAQLTFLPPEGWPAPKANNPRRIPSRARHATTAAVLPTPHRTQEGV